MKKMFLIFAIIMMFPALAWPAHIGSDPNPGATFYKVKKLPAGEVVRSDALADGSIYYDVITVPVGENSFEIIACSGEAAIWGEACGTAVNFQFPRPNVIAPNNPGGLKLVK